MIGGLLAGAMAGGGEALQHNAKSQIEQKRQTALESLRQKHRVDLEDNRQAFQSSEREAGEVFTSGENQANRQHDTRLARMREQGANNRAAMNRNDWEVMQTADGSLARINSRTGEIAPMDSGGLDFGSEAWTDRDQAYLDSLQAEMEGLQEEAKTGMLSDEQKQRMQQIPQDMRTYAEDIDTDNEVYGAHEGIQGGGNGSPPPLITKPGSGQPPPSSDNADSESSRDYLNNRQQQQAEAERNREADTRVSKMTDEAKRIAGRLTIPNQFGGFQRGGLLNRAASGGIDQQAERQAAQQVLADVAAEHDTETDDVRKAQLKEAMDALLDAGVTLPRQR